MPRFSTGTTARMNDARDERMGIRRHGRYINNDAPDAPDCPEPGRSTIAFCNLVAAEQMHGYASEAYDMQVIGAAEQPRVFEADGLTCQFVKPPRGFTVPAAPETDGVRSVDPLGMDQGDDARARHRGSVRPSLSGRRRGGAFQLPRSGGARRRERAGCAYTLWCRTADTIFSARLTGCLTLYRLSLHYFLPSSTYSRTLGLFDEYAVLDIRLGY